jgi:hypothetical protein
VASITRLLKFLIGILLMILLGIAAQHAEQQLYDLTHERPTR